MVERDYQWIPCAQAAAEGNVDAVARYFTTKHDDIANRNDEHRELNRVQRDVSESERFTVTFPWFAGHWADCLVATLITKDPQTDVVQWLFARDQLVLVGEILRGIANTALSDSLDPFLTTSILEILVESPMFTEVMDDQESAYFLARLLRMATRAADTALVNMLLGYGADPEFQRALRGTPIDLTASHSDTKTLDLLLDHGVWLEKVPLENQLFQAQSSVTVFGELVRRGADVNAVVNNYGSVLHIATRMSLDGHVDILIKTGYADVDARGGLNRTPLMVMGAIGNPNTLNTDMIIFILLNNGADLQAVDRFGRGVLHHAVLAEMAFSRMRQPNWKANLALIKILLARGVNPNHQDDHGQTPMLALLDRTPIEVDPNIHDILMILLHAGADPFLRDHQGKSSIDMLRIISQGESFLQEKQAFFRQTVKGLGTAYQ